jgi:hypothetical protein
MAISKVAPRIRRDPLTLISTVGAIQPKARGRKRMTRFLSAQSRSSATYVVGT